MTLAEFYNKVEQYHQDHPTYRRGQALFNVLHEVRPELANKIRATPTDPFHSTGAGDPKYVSAVEYIARNWVLS